MHEEVHRGSAVREPTPAYKAMQVERRFPHLLAQGLGAIREASAATSPASQLSWWQRVWSQHTAADPQGQMGFIVQHPSETPEGFRTRIELAQFEDIYWGGCRNIAYMPFVQAVTYTKETPQEVRDWDSNIESDISLAGIAGRDLRSFARWACTNVTGFGLGGLLANMIEGAERPYLQYLPGSAILETRFRRPRHPGRSKGNRLSRVRILTHAARPGSAERGVDARGEPWFTETYERVMVLYDGDPLATDGSDAFYSGFELYDLEDPADPRSPWRTKPTEKLTPLRPQPAIPLAELYTGYEGAWFNRPVLRHLAQAERVWINCRNDLDSIVKTASVPLWDWAGASEDDERRHGVISAGNIFRATNPSAHLRPAEFTGGSMKVASDELAALERRMQAMALGPMVTRPTGGETATARAIDEARANTQAEAHALGWADSFSQALQFMAIYRRLPDEVVRQVGVDFHHDFGIRTREIKFAEMLTEAMLAEKLDPLRWGIEMKRIGAFGEDMVPQDEADWVKKNQTVALESLIGLQAAKGTAPAGAPRAEGVTVTDEPTN